MSNDSKSRLEGGGKVGSGDYWGGGGGGGWHKASVSDCLSLAAPIGLSPVLILTLCGPERVLVVSMEPPDDLSCLTTPGVGCPGDGLLPVPLTRCIQGGGGGDDCAFCRKGKSGCGFKCNPLRAVVVTPSPQ